MGAVLVCQVVRSVVRVGRLSGRQVGRSAGRGLAQPREVEACMRHGVNRWLTGLSFFLGVVIFSSTPALAQDGGIRGGISIDPDQFYFGGHLETSPLVDRLYFRPRLHPIRGSRGSFRCTPGCGRLEIPRRSGCRPGQAISSSSAAPWSRQTDAFRSGAIIAQQLLAATHAVRERGVEKSCSLVRSHGRAIASTPRRPTRSIRPCPTCRSRRRTPASPAVQTDASS